MQSAPVRVARALFSVLRDQKWKRQRGGLFLIQL